MSDLHFGEAHAYKAGLPTVQSLAHNVLKAVGNQKIDAVVVTGDLSSSGLPVEFEQAGGFLHELTKGLKLPAKSVVVVPGNHDVCWDPKGPSLDAYNQFIDQRRFPQPPVVSLPQTGSAPALRILGLSSCRVESKEHAGVGCVGEPHELITPPAAEGEALIVCLHHHLVPVTDVERAYHTTGRVSVTLDARAVLRACLEAGVSMVLHGHQHQPHITKFGDMTDGSLRELWVVGAGTAGAKTVGALGHRQFQLLEFHHGHQGPECSIGRFLSDQHDELRFAAQHPPVSLLMQSRIPNVHGMSWQQFNRGLDGLIRKIVKDGIPEVVVGVQGGGLAMADLLAKSLWAQHKSAVPVLAAYSAKSYLSQQPSPLLPASDHIREKRVLLVDDFYTNGEALFELQEQLRAFAPASLKVAVFRRIRHVDDRRVDQVIDYFAEEVDGKSGSILDGTMPWTRIPRPAKEDPP